MIDGVELSSKNVIESIYWKGRNGERSRNRSAKEKWRWRKSGRGNKKQRAEGREKLDESSRGTGERSEGVKRNKPVIPTHIAQIISEARVRK
jgi:hypothetical protein